MEQRGRVSFSFCTEAVANSRGPAADWQRPKAAVWTSAQYKATNGLRWVYHGRSISCFFVRCCR